MALPVGGGTKGTCCDPATKPTREQCQQRFGRVFAHSQCHKNAAGEVYWICTPPTGMPPNGPVCRNGEGTGGGTGNTGGGTGNTGNTGGGTGNTGGGIGNTGGGTGDTGGGIGGSGGESGGAVLGNTGGGSGGAVVRAPSASPTLGQFLAIVAAARPSGAPSSPATAGGGAANVTRTPPPAGAPVARGGGQNASPRRYLAPPRDPLIQGLFR